MFRCLIYVYECVHKCRDIFLAQRKLGVMVGKYFPARLCFESLEVSIRGIDISSIYRILVKNGIFISYVTRRASLCIFRLQYLIFATRGNIN